MQTLPTPPEQESARPARREVARPEGRRGRFPFPPLLFPPPPPKKLDAAFIFLDIMRAPPSAARAEKVEKLHQDSPVARRRAVGTAVAKLIFSIIRFHAPGGSRRA